MGESPRNQVSVYKVNHSDIVVAGPPDIVDAADPHGAWDGRQGGVLAMFAAKDGQELVERQLPSPPVWDGLAAARGRLFVHCRDGSIACLGKAPMED